MFYRPGGSASRINAQYDEVYADFVGGATGWLPVNKGDWVGVKVARASIVYGNAASSTVTKVPQFPEATVLMEQKTIGGQTNAEAWPIDQWQNAIVSTGRRVHDGGWVRLRVLNINSQDGTGIAMRLQVSRTGDPGASV